MWYTKRKNKKKTSRKNQAGVNTGEGQRPAESMGTQQGPKTIQLVAGRFSAVEAADVLISLINDKIRHHTIKTLNMNVADDLRNHSQSRIDDLRKSKEEIKELVVRGSRMGKWVEINSIISIKLVDQPSAAEEGTIHNYGFTSTGG